MNRYSVLCRITGPAMIVLTGILALLDNSHILSWGKSWPLYLITLGVIRLAQRTALSQVEADAYPVYPSATPPPPAAASADTATSIVPAADPRPDPTEWRP